MTSSVSVKLVLNGSADPKSRQMPGAFSHTFVSFWTCLILDHLPYSLELTPSDFHLFLHLKKHLAVKNFDDEDLQEKVMTWFKEQAADF